MKVMGLFIVFVLSSISVRAEDYLDMDLENLMKVKITGSTLREESLETVPSSVTVFTRQQIDLLAVDYLHELVSLVPGFQVHRNGDNGIGYPMSSRGRKQTTRGREILLIVDGRLLNNSRAGGVDSAIPIYPLGSVERVEIIRGPSSAIYGSGAMMGVINIISRKQQSDLTIAMGSQERQQLDLQWGYNRELLSSDISLHFNEDKGDDFKNSTQSFSDPRRELHLDAMFSYDDTHLSFLHSDTRSMGFYTSEYLNDDFNQYNQKFDHLALEQDWSPSQNWKMDLYLAYQRTRHQVWVNTLPAGALAAVSQPTSNAPLLSEAKSLSRDAHMKWANDFTLTPKSSLQWGLEWRRAYGSESDTRVFSNFDLLQLSRNEFPVRSSRELEFATSIMGDFDTRLVSAYSQYLTGIGDKTRITLGLRHDSYRHVDSRTSPRLGLVFLANNVHTFKLLYGEAFRAPSLIELYTTNNTSLIGNTELISERVKTWDLIWQMNLASVVINVDLYHNELVNPIENGFLSNGGARTYLNGEGSRYFGSEIQVDWQISNHWSLRASYSKIFNLPDEAFREADNIQQLMLQYQSESWSWNIAAVQQGEAESLTPSGDTENLDSNTQINSRIRFDVTEDLDLELSVKNVLDNDNHSAAQSTRIPLGIPHRGREWALGLTWGW